MSLAERVQACGAAARNEVLPCREALVQTLLSVTAQHVRQCFENADVGFAERQVCMEAIGLACERLSCLSVPPESAQHAVSLLASQTAAVLGWLQARQERIEEADVAGDGGAGAREEEEGAVVDMLVLALESSWNASLGEQLCQCVTEALASLQWSLTASLPESAHHVLNSWLSAVLASAGAKAYAACASRIFQALPCAAWGRLDLATPLAQLQPRSQGKLRAAECIQAVAARLQDSEAGDGSPSSALWSQALIALGGAGCQEHVFQSVLGLTARSPQRASALALALCAALAPAAQLDADWVATWIRLLRQGGAHVLTPEQCLVSLCLSRHPRLGGTVLSELKVWGRGSLSTCTGPRA
ncbi:hypothetical protein H632_c1862p0 [Helicosporidium sp. ATCC 50920]|nr:hypothetical protein H632_c1862p0 [Helicosporidium sp. ATCC 50920]|eukprot:KDD73757.1 hypothetical protein H632_c1862p0 [Helicosporidium sp. ATCC 50920]